MLAKSGRISLNAGLTVVQEQCKGGRYVAVHAQVAFSSNVLEVGHMLATGGLARNMLAVQEWMLAVKEQVKKQYRETGGEQ